MQSRHSTLEAMFSEIGLGTPEEREPFLELERLAGDKGPPPGYFVRLSSATDATSIGCLEGDDDAQLA